MNSGAHSCRTTQRQKTKVYYSSVVAKAREQSNIDKNSALTYFYKQKAYQTTSANRSYADALKYGKNTLLRADNTLVPVSRITRPDPVKQGVSTKIPRPAGNRPSVTTCFNKSYNQHPAMHITLHNRFDVFNTVDTTDGLDVPLLCHKNAFVVKNMDNASVGAVRTQLGEDHSPVLERKSKISLVGKKTKLGVLMG